MPALMRSSTCRYCLFDFHYEKTDDTVDEVEFATRIAAQHVELGGCLFSRKNPLILFDNSRRVWISLHQWYIIHIIVFSFRMFCFFFIGKKR